MRSVLVSLVLVSAGLFGLAHTPVAEAQGSGRLYVGIGDVYFSYGRPYYRHTREPLFVVYDYGYPRYYRAAPVPVYYAPPPRHGYGYGPRYRDWRDDRRHDWRHDRRDHRHDRRWDDDHHRGRDRHRRRDWD